MDEKDVNEEDVSEGVHEEVHEENVVADILGAKDDVAENVAAEISS